MRFFSATFLLFVCLAASAQQKEKVIVPSNSPSIYFTENTGQWDKKILFRSDLSGGHLFLEKNCLTFNMFDKKKVGKMHSSGLTKSNTEDFNIACHAYKVHFEGCATETQITKKLKTSHYENFYIGNDKSKWKSFVPGYKQIWINDLYPGIDYELLGSGEVMKYNFHVQRGANPSTIQLRYEGIPNLKIKNGELHLDLGFNTIIEQKPYAYQEIDGRKHEVKCDYQLNGNTVSFVFPRGYDPNSPLIIDPVLVFSAQIGSTADNFGMTATFDNAGNLYSGGIILDFGYPYVTGSYSGTFNGPAAYGNIDVFITKYNAGGTNLIYSTHLGGSGSEVVSSLIVDKNNNLYLYGATSSSNFPITAGAAYPNFSSGPNFGMLSNGTVFYAGTDIYISKFDAAGSALLGSTYFGGTGNDGLNYLKKTNYTTFPLNPAPGTGTTYVSNYDSLMTNYGDTFRGEIQLDSLNNVYIASSTRSSNIPIVGGFDNSLGGVQDAVIAKFNTNLTSLIYSSYIGGSDMESGNGLFVTPTFEVFVTGGTASSDFPNMAGGHSPNFNGGNSDGFLTKINAAGNVHLQSTYIGTSNYDNSFFVQCNTAGEPHVFGQSRGAMPVQLPAGATTIYSVSNTHQFISKYNTSLTSRQWSTVFGSNTNNFDISPSAFAVDECNGNIYLSGWGGNILLAPPGMSGMPLLNATQATTNGYDFYLMALTPNAGSLLYGSYFGGNTSQEHVDGGTSRFDRKGVIYQSVCAGCGGYDDFPITPGAWPCPGSPTCPNPNLTATRCNNGVFKIDFNFQNPVATLNTNTLAGCPPLNVSLTNATPGTGFTWYFPGGVTNSVTLNPALTFTNPGTYTISLVVHDTLKCIKKDSAVKVITVYPRPQLAFTSTLTPCSGTLLTNNTSTASGSYIWNFGDATPTTTLQNPSHIYSNTGNYTVTLTGETAQGCKDSIKTPVQVLIFDPLVSSDTICEGFGALLNSSGGTNYTWTPSSGISNPNNANIIVSPSVTTVYSVTIVNNSTGQNCTETLTTQVIVYPKPTAAFNLSVNPCGGGVYFTDLSSPLISSWQWTLAPSVYSGQQNPYHFYANGGTNTVTLIVTTPEGCKDTVSQPISVPVPPAVAVSGSTLLCKGSSVQLNASGGTSYQWSPAASLDFSSISSPNASPTITTQYSVVITTSNNCSFLLTTNVNVYNNSSIPVSASASPPFVVTGNSTTLTYLGSPGFLVTWLPPGSTTPPTGYTVTATPDKPTTYTAIATNGPCNERAVVFVEAYTAGCIEKDAFVPNTFTPNGDGNNDVFIVRGLKVEEIYFAVYNRWGELVFETTDKTKGWDGLYKGRPADVGVFGWYLKVKCFNGEETFRKGNVTLIR